MADARMSADDFVARAERPISPREEPFKKTGPRRNANRPEQALQISVVHALRWIAPDLVVFHPANGGLRSKREASLLRAMGVTPGVSDLVFCLPDGRFAAIELKADKGRLSPEQADFLEHLEAIGAPCGVARSLDDVLGFLRAWGVPTKARAA